MNLTVVILTCLLMLSIIVTCLIIIRFLDIDYENKKTIKDLTWVFVNQKQKANLDLINKDNYNKIMDNYLKTQFINTNMYNILTLKVANDLKDLQKSNPEIQLNTDAIALLNSAERVKTVMNEGMCKATEGITPESIRKFVWGCKNN